MDIFSGAIAGSGFGFAVPAKDMFRNLAFDFGPEFFHLPGDGGEFVLLVREGAIDFGVAEKGAQGGFGKPAGITVGGIEEGADAVFGQVDGKFLHGWTEF